MILNMRINIMLRQLASTSIIGYQRYLSPYKGFCCAYHHETGKDSCSAYALRVVRRKGALALFTALPRQFARCREAYLMFLTRQQKQLGQQDKKGIFNVCDACDPCIFCDIDVCDCGF